jgi:hypothetical protein
MRAHASNLNGREPMTMTTMQERAARVVELVDEVAASLEGAEQEAIRLVNDSYEDELPAYYGHVVYDEAKWILNSIEGALSPGVEFNLEALRSDAREFTEILNFVAKRAAP